MIETLDDALIAIARDHPLLESLMVGVRTGQGGRTTSPESPIPGGVTYFSVSTAVAREIAFLCGVVIDGHDDCGRAPDRVGPRAEWLKPYAKWIEEVLGEGDLGDILQAADELARVVAPDAVRRIPVGLCPVVSCPGGALWARLDAVGKRRMPDVVCDADSSHRWDEFAYHRLAAMLDGEAPPGRMSIPEWLAWAKTRGRAPTMKQVQGWARHLPITVGWSDTEKRLDAVRTMEHWLDVRARRAS